ncbi:MAG: tetratricopeptide repeat protein, partial [Leptolyngbya sp. DLM2.Bin15]
MGDRAKQRRLGKSMTHRTRRLLSLTLATVVVTGGLPSAWAEVTAETTHPSNVSPDQLALQSGTTTNVEGSARLVEEARRLNAQGFELYQAGRYAEAEPLLLQTLEIFREQLGDRHPDISKSLYDLANLYQAQGRYEEAEP